MNPNVYSVWLAECPGCSPEQRQGLLEQFGSAQAVWEAEEPRLREVRGMTKRQLEALLEKDLTHAGLILDDCERLGIRTVSCEQEEYPSPLRGLPDAPVLLYVLGTLPEWERTIPIGMVGTRRATSYGLRAARWLAGQLAHEGCVIVSGMALGIDGQSHCGALDAGGITVAVLGCGLDVCYPPQHEELMHRILQEGAVISEYPPGTEPKSFHFPKRNRIISGLCRGMVLVEVPKKSGALITADRALEQGRDVFAVPGNINSAQSMGTNRLLREGGAELITCAADVLSHYPDEREGLIPTEIIPVMPPAEAAAEKRRKPGKKAARRTEPISEPEAPPDFDPFPDAEPVPEEEQMPLSEEEQTVLDTIRGGADCVDAIVEASGMSVSKTLACLTMLEISGRVRRDGASVQENR